MINLQQPRNSSHKGQLSDVHTLVRGLCYAGRAFPQGAYLFILYPQDVQTSV